MWHSLAVHGGTSLGGLRAFAIVQKEGVLELPEKSIDVAGTSRVLSGGMQLYGQFPGMGDGDDDMPALVGDSDGEDMPELFFSDSDEEDIHAPPGLRARTEGVVDAEYARLRALWMQNTLTVHQEVSSQEAWMVTTLDARTMPRTVSARERQTLVLPIVTDSDSDNEEMPTLLPPEDTDSDELPALLPNAAARQRPQAPGPCQCSHSLAGGFAKPGRQG
jgi:hypothetical protein